MPPLSLIKAVVPEKCRQKLREHLVSTSVTHVNGPRSLDLARNEAVVTCVVRNGEYYIESFIEHYLRMGFQHIFFLDNGSTDQTIAIAKTYSNVSICQSALPISSHQRLFKKYLAQRAARGGWCLDADIDEFFDYPYSEVLPLQNFLDYLNGHEYTAVITQMLDMFSDKPLSHLASEQKEDLPRAYPYFDLSNIASTSYRTSELTAKFGSANRISNEDTALYWGGIRKTLYGNNCLLSKHSLFRPDAGVQLFPHVHFVDKSRLADVSGVLLHYKLTSNAMAVAMQNRDHFKENSKTYNAFIEVIKEQSTREIIRESAERFQRSVELVERKFLMMSPAYEGYAMEKKVRLAPLDMSTSKEYVWPASRA